MSDSYYAKLTNFNLKDQHVKHYVGFPLEVGKEGRSLLPKPDLLIIELKSDGAYLTRYNNRGEFCGETWHQDRKQAEHQARFEYGNKIGKWRKIPAGVTDPISFVIYSGE